MPLPVFCVAVLLFLLLVLRLSAAAWFVVRGVIVTGCTSVGLMLLVRPLSTRS
jgi:hypothetical protein